jgi:hypothetical protein
MSPIAPPRWASEELEVARRAAITKFREERLQEPLGQYLQAFDRNLATFDEILSVTADLADWRPHLQVLTNAALLEALRYLAGPPISRDDLEVLADASLAPTRLRADRDMAQRVMETVLTALDRQRFPWVAEGRAPTPPEREAASLASSALMTTQQLATSRRSESKTTQEQTVAAALTSAGFTQVPAHRIPTVADAPAPGEFCGESLFGTRKADFVVGLWDGRKMPVECKVSNSSTNSVKRLNNDAAVKAVRWIEEFGTVQTVPAAVLSGVYKRHNLEAAQVAGLSIFWAHALDSMLDWIEQTRRPV